MAMWTCVIPVLWLWKIAVVEPGPRYSSRIVDTRAGPVRGIIQSSNSRHLEPVEIFYGIPYAAPPVGTRRFVAAKEPLPWSGTRLADTPTPACPQVLPDISNETEALRRWSRTRYQQLTRLLPLLTNQSEDCLHLNIYVPGSGSRGLYAPYAVIVYVHGESYEWNSGNHYDGRVLTSYGHVIFITLNYRLGILGFLRLEENQDSQNCCFALTDLEAALRWVNVNIDAFGGDPTRVTLVGHDTGAALVSALLLKTSARGLFHRVSILSGSLLSPWAVPQAPQHQTLMRKLGCDSLHCLQALPVQTLVEAVPQDPPGSRFLPRFGPWFSSSASVEVEHAGDTFIDRHMLIGLTSIESFYDFHATHIETGVRLEERDEILRSFIDTVYSYHVKEIFSAVRNEYTQWNNSGQLAILRARDAILHALSDGHTAAPLLRLAHFHSRRGAVTYLFHLAHQSDKQLRQLGLESVRGDIIPYILGSSLTGGQTDTSELIVAHTVIRFFTNFAKTGDPNSPGAEPDYENDKASSNTWDMFEPVKQLYLSIGEETRVRSHYRGHKMALWLHLVHQLQSPGDMLTRFHQLGNDDDQEHLFAGVVRPKIVSRGRVTPTVPVAAVDCVGDASAIAVPDNERVGGGGGGLAQAFTLAGPWGITLGLACVLLVCNLLLLASVYRRQCHHLVTLPQPPHSADHEHPLLAKSQSAPQLTLLSETPTSSSSLFKRPELIKSSV